ncbi:MAG TPA: hypothetical protein VF530_20745 [Planctomycetota bacterium]
MRSLLLVLALGGPAAAQGEIKPFPKIDPYTKDDPGAKERAGYASFGPFRFGDDHTTSQIETTLGGIPLIWVETDHFKIGSGLPEYALDDDAKEKEKVRKELERLAKRLPDVKVKAKKLDPWLRLHLHAQRLEELYAQFLARFRLDENDFPTAPPDAKSAGPYMGEGRYLGMPAKFTVLLFDKKSSVGRYSGVYLGQALNTPTRWVFPTVGSFLFLTAAEFLEGEYQNDTALHCDVVSGVVQNLAAGFRGYRVVLPFAVSEGIAHWFSREIDPRYHIFSGLDLTRVRIRDESNWAPSVRARVEHKVFASTHDMLGWSDADSLEWADHLILWSRLDYLMQREDGAAGSLLRLLKEPPGTKTGQLTPEETLARARQAFQTIAGGDLARFDADWGEWVLRTYPKK